MVARHRQNVDTVS